MNYVDVIGIGLGPRDLTAFHMKLIGNADLLIGGARQLAMFPGHKGETFQITGNIQKLVQKIKEEMGSRKIVILASGDPLFYGIGSTLSRHLSQDQLRIHPNITSMAAAFARIGVPWQDAKIISLHSGLSEDIDFSSCLDDEKIIFLTSPQRGPAFIAEQINKYGRTGIQICVLERLGDTDWEKITWFSHMDTVLQTHFSDPNLVILTQPHSTTDNGTPPTDVPHETHLGMPDAYFSHSRGLITKSEIRTLSLAKLKFTRKAHVLWDIGAGSGSVGLEAALMIPSGKVFAIEKNPDRVKDIQRNIKKFGLTNVVVETAVFPDKIEFCQAPDRVFIGGGGQDLDKIICEAVERLMPGGIIVVNTVIIGNMTAAMKTLDKLNMTPEMIHVQISRSDPIAHGHRLDPLNPVWIISGRKPK